MKSLHLWGVRQNNLKDVEVKIPIGSFTVICGPSGSGKSSLAFETIYAEGQRRYIESLSNYTKQFLNKAPKPDIDGIENIPPSLALEQKNRVKTSRSTVGTMTEIVDYLRLLYSKIGVTYCPYHNIPLEKNDVAGGGEKILNEFQGERGYILALISAKDRVLGRRQLYALLAKEGYLRIYSPSPSVSKGSGGRQTRKKRLRKVLSKKSYKQV